MVYKVMLGSLHSGGGQVSVCVYTHSGRRGCGLSFSHSALDFSRAKGFCRADSL